MDLSDDEEQVRRHLDRLEDGGFDKYQAYLGVAQLNLEVWGLTTAMRSPYKTTSQVIQMMTTTITTNFKHSHSHNNQTDVSRLSPFQAAKQDTPGENPWFLLWG